MSSRRTFLRHLGASAAAGALAPSFLRAVDAASEEKFPPVRALTRGPKFHWFGNCDKDQFSADGRFVLGNQVDFEGRSPRADDTIRVGVIDLRGLDLA